MIFTEFIARQTADLLNPRNHGTSAANRDNDNETGGLLNRWICLLNCLFVCYCYRFVPSLVRAGKRKGKPCVGIPAASGRRDW